MSFSEFLRAVDNPFRLKALENGDWKLVETLQEDFKTLLRKYLFVGGMPEAVADFVETGDYTAVRTSLQPYHDGENVKDIPLYAFGIHVSRLLSPAR